MAGMRKFPRQRDDGSAQIAARYGGERQALELAIIEGLNIWEIRIRQQNESVTKEFLQVPHMRPVNGEVQVVFDVRPGSTFWKDRMVQLVGDILKSGIDIEFLGFDDLVSGHRHPATAIRSRSKDRPDGQEGSGV